MTNILSALANLADEPIVSTENEKHLQDIINITRTSEFTSLALTEEKLDELTECLMGQEIFAKEIPGITKGLELVSSIVLPDEEDEEEYI